MFTVNIDGLNYKVDFSYGWEYRGKHTYNRVTYCRITAQNGDLVEEASSSCSVKDAFVKNEGRKRALTRLLKACNMPRNNRALVWDAYFAARGKHS